jgi:hypothetical protein
MYVASGELLGHGLLAVLAASCDTTSDGAAAVRHTVAPRCHITPLVRASQGALGISCTWPRQPPGQCLLYSR